jgi:hypothetical protein
MDPKKATAPYGSWESPITAAAVSAAGRTVEGLAVAGDGRLVWVEKRPDEGGYAKPSSTHSHYFPFLFFSPRSNLGTRRVREFVYLKLLLLFSVRASVLVREPAPAEPRRKALDVTPPGFAVRTLAQEYGGGSGAFAVQGNTVVFSNYSDQRLYRQTIGGAEFRLCLYSASPTSYVLPLSSNLRHIVFQKVKVCKFYQHLVKLYACLVYKICISRFIFELL